MKTCSVSSAASVFLGLAALSQLALADTFFLKDGTSVNGTVLREDSSSYVLEVQVTKSIKDERTIAKADVTKVEKEQAGAGAFEDIAKLVPAPDALTQNEYGARIRLVEKFLKDYPASSKYNEAKKILATLKAEANEVLAGGIKLNGRIIPPSEYRANAYEYDSLVEAAKIRALVNDGHYLQALRAFSTFSGDYRNTTVCADLAPLMKRVIASYLAETGHSLDTFDARVKERQIGLDRMTAADRPKTEKAILEETAGFEARLKSEKDAKVGWVTTNPFFKPSLEETMTFGKQELTRLDALKSQPQVDGGKAYREALALIQAKGDKAAVTAALTSAKTAGVPDRYLAILTAAAAAN